MNRRLAKAGEGNHRLWRLAGLFTLAIAISASSYAGNGITHRDASGTIVAQVDFVETTLIQGAVGVIGSGTYLESETFFHSGEIVELSETKVVLRYGEEVHEFTLGDKTEFCAEGILSRSRKTFPDTGRATVLVAKGGKNPIRVYDRPLLFQLSVGGAVFIPFECGAGGTSLGRDQIREVQELLSKLGYEPGPVDGLAGGRTRKAIRAFEVDEGLEPSGALTPEILKRIKERSLDRN